MTLTAFLRMLPPLALAAHLFASPATASAVDINQATEAELQTVKGIGPGLSTKILNERRKGSFKDWGDMVDRIPGVGPGNAGKLSAQGLTVNGAPYSSHSASGASKRFSAPKGHGVITTVAPPAAAPTAKAASPDKPASAPRKKSRAAAARAHPSALKSVARSGPP